MNHSQARYSSGGGISGDISGGSISGGGSGGGGGGFVVVGGGVGIVVGVSNATSTSSDCLYSSFCVVDAPFSTAFIRPPLRQHFSHHPGPPRDEL
jgi:hypothetical protein